MRKRTREIFQAIGAASIFPDRAKLLGFIAGLGKAQATHLMHVALTPDDYGAVLESATAEASEIAASWKFRFYCCERKTLTLILDGEHFGCLPTWFDEKIATADDVHLHITRGNGGVIGEIIAAAKILAECGKWRTAFVAQHALSASALLFVLAPRRIMHPKATLMLHHPSIVAFGDAITLRASADHLEKVQEDIARLLEARGIDPARFFRPGFDAVLTAEQAVKMNLCDEVSDCR